MKVHLEGVVPAIQWYIKNGWRVDHFPTEVNEYLVYSPTGSVFRSDDFITRCCPFCDELSPNWEEGFCNHSQKLLDEELNARNLWELIQLEDSLQYRNLP